MSNMATPPILESVKERLKKIEAGDFSALPDSALLRELKLLTQDSRLNQDAKRKLKQIFHLLRQILPYLENIFGESEFPTIIDAGAGKAYFGYILGDFICKPLKKGTVISIESRKELIERCRRLADQMQLGPAMQFIEATIESVQTEQLPRETHLVCALHACDTATDDAILLGLKANTRYFALVPCCQAELAHSLKELPKDSAWPLWRHPIHAREFGSHLSNVIRCLVLESHGYKVHVTEFTGWEHSLKNELIMAEKIQMHNALAQKQLDSLLKILPVKMKLLQKVGELNTSK
jgi:hypothetical protein